MHISVQRLEPHKYLHLHSRSLLHGPLKIKLVQRISTTHSLSPFPDLVKLEVGPEKDMGSDFPQDANLISYHSIFMIEKMIMES